MRRGATISAIAIGLLVVLAGVWRPLASLSWAVPKSTASAQRGYQLLTEQPYLPADFDADVLDALWQQWDEPARSVAERATTAERRTLIMSRYGLSGAAEQRAWQLFQYTPLSAESDAPRSWAMNCLACHGGTLLGEFLPGLPNTRYDLQTLTEHVRATKLAQQKKLTHMDRGVTIVPLSASVGTTNAVSFGKLLLAYRDEDLNLIERRFPPILLHHDMDAPPWWNVRRKQRLYIDGFAPKSPRALMQFLLIPRNKREHFEAWESDYQQILAWMETLTPPKYPFPIDGDLAAQGKLVFNRTCSECHGTYGPDGHYPERNVPIGDIGTDRVRFDALTGEGRRRYAQSWFARDAQVETVVDPVGYVAPPLDGIWASSPYLHNGSVPSVWQLLKADDRPIVWRRADDAAYDQRNLGFVVTTADELPEAEQQPPARRRWFDTRLWGKGAAGHRFGDVLTDGERRAVIEYLKML